MEAGEREKLKHPGGLSRHALGFLMLGGTMVLWVASSVTIQMIFEGVHFEKPVFVTLFNSASSVSLLLPRLARLCGIGGGKAGTSVKSSRGNSSGLGDGKDVSLAFTARLSATVGLLWLCSQWIFNLSLLYTSVATNTVLSSTSSVFVFFFSLLICRDRFRPCSCAASFASFMGCVIVSMESPRNVAETAVTNSGFGDILTLSSAALFALVSVMLRKLAPEEFDLSFWMGLNGLLALGLSPGVLYAAHQLGVEDFRPPPGNTLLALTVNAVLGSTCANYLYTNALLLLSPLVSTVCMSLSIPISALTDEVVLHQHSFSMGWLIGAGFVSASVVFAAFDLEVPPSDGAKANGEKAEELQSLLAEHDRGAENDRSLENARIGDGQELRNVNR